MSFLITSAAIAGGSALYGIGKGISQNAQANKIDKNNPRPSYDIPQEYINNVNMAKQMAQVGLPQQQYNNQLNNINQNQSAGLQVLSNSANPGANLASIVRAGDAATGNLNAQDAAARQQNQRFAIGQNGILGQQELAQQQYNKFDKYTEQFNKSAALRGASNQNMQNAVNGLSSTATNLYGLGQGGDNDAVKVANSGLGPRQTATTAVLPPQQNPALVINLPQSQQQLNAPVGLGVYSRYAQPANQQYNPFYYGQKFNQ